MSQVIAEMRGGVGCRLRSGPGGVRRYENNVFRDTHLLSPRDSGSGDKSESNPLIAV